MTMAQDSPRFERIYNLASLGRAGDEVRVSAPGEELVRIARWAKVRSLASFEATVELRMLSPERFRYDALLKCEIVQDCVVTLEPVRTVIERKIHRELHLTDSKKFDPEVVVDANAEDDDVREEIQSPRYDLAAPLLEELALAIDPYPRAPGVAFAPPDAPEVRPESPFAVLKKLKKP